MRIAVLAISLGSAAASMAADPAAGMWQVSDGGPVIELAESADTPGRLDILWVDGADMSIAPGTQLGSATATPTPGLYDCSAWIDPRGETGRKRGKAQFTIRLDSKLADSFVFEGYQRGTVLRLSRLLPFWYRRPVQQVDTRPKGLDGARRIHSHKSYLEL